MCIVSSFNKYKLIMLQNYFGQFRQIDHILSSIDRNLLLFELLVVIYPFFLSF